ncbi:secretion ATPase [Klebsiella pneumoniae]|uniref:Secretion ATPase n=1 Tax=Klebsiella pneumoniae TaxID=573 RepID=A0A378FUQ6_KLEPN|nr:secretion ATPase [Klebsiella pneumoniae]
MTIGLLVMLTLYGGWLTWVVVGFTLCYAIMRLVTYRFYRRVAEEQVIKGARSSSHFMESLYGISTIKALNLKERRSQHWLNINIDACNAGIKQTRFDMMFSGVNTFISAIDQVAVLWLGAIMVIDNEMTLGMFMAFNAYRGQFRSGLQAWWISVCNCGCFLYIMSVYQRLSLANRKKSFPRGRSFLLILAPDWKSKPLLSI